MKNWRLNLFLVIIFCAAATIMCRLFYLQVLDYKFYRSQALGQQAGFQEIQGSRGEIFSENSKESKGSLGSDQIKNIAINEEKWLLFAVGKRIQDKDQFAKTVAQALEDQFGAENALKKEDILAKLEISDSYVIVKKDIKVKDLEPFKKLALEGLSWEKVYDRHYPEGAFASQVVGFFGGDQQGQYGLEGYYEDILRGKQGIREEKRGLDLINAQDQSYLNGSDLYLTIDYNIQYQAEFLLKEAKKNIYIESGQILVLKPDSGRVLALANYPSFDLNAYGKEKDLDIFQNAAVQKIFEPGSIFKPLTMAIALNDGKISPETTFTDTGSVKIGPDIVYNFDRQKYGLRDMSGILEKSINTGAVFVSQLVSHQTFLDYLNKFGFNDKTGIDLQGEVHSRNDLLKTGPDFGYATASFGQGIEMTPIQLARAFCIFANGGKIIKPYIVQKIIHGQDELEIKPEISNSVISEKTANDVTKMLINVIEKGFGSEARIKGYYLAGKTGTAEVPFKDKKGYHPDRTIQSFIGFGPALKPQFLILVKLDNPKVPKSSLSAAPIFKKMAQYLIDYWQIPPDY